MPSIIEQQWRAKRKEKQDAHDRLINSTVRMTEKESAYVQVMTKKVSDRFRKEITDTRNASMKDYEPQIREYIKTEVMGMPDSEMNLETKLRVIEFTTSSVIGLGPIQVYMEDPEVTEIMVVKWDQIYFEKKGIVYLSKSSFIEEQHLRNVLDRYLAKAGKSVSRKNPICDSTLEDGSRVCATIPPISPSGATLTIRKFQNELMTVDKYIEYGSITKEGMEFLELCVANNLACLISGGTGTGKTTCLNALSAYIPSNIRILTIEDTKELQLKQSHVVSLVTRETVGDNQVNDMAALVKTALRMRPDKIILGEIRDGAILDFLSASATGHDGSMCTVHSDSPETLIDTRLPIMMSQNEKGGTFPEDTMQMMFSDALQLVIQLKRFGPGYGKSNPDPKYKGFAGKRIIERIVGVNGYDPKTSRVSLVDIYAFDYTTMQLVQTGYMPEMIAETLSRQGVIFKTENGLTTAIFPKGKETVSYNYKLVKKSETYHYDSDALGIASSN